MKRVSFLSLILFFVIYFMCSGVPIQAQSSKQVKSFDELSELNKKVKDTGIQAMMINRKK